MSYELHEAVKEDLRQLSEEQQRAYCEILRGFISDD